MAFEPVFETTKLDNLKRVCSSQAVVEARLLPSGGASISRVLSIGTDCSVTPSEVFAGEARYNGKVSFQVIFVDTEGANHSMDYSADFTEKLTNDSIIAGLKPVITANILDTDIVSVDERELKLACVVEVSLDAVLSENINILTNGGNDVYTHEESIEYAKLVSEVNETFIVNDTITDVECTSIMLTEAKVVVTNRRASIDSVVIEGRIVNEIVCQSSDGAIMSQEHVTNFVQEVSAPNAREDYSVAAFATLVTKTANLESDGDKGAIVLEYQLLVEGKVFADAQANPVVDAFSVTNELLQSGQSVNITKAVTQATLSDRVEGSVTLDINMPAADAVLAVTGTRLNVANITPTNGRLNYEGVASCNIIYLNTEDNSKNSVAVELPFSITANANVEEGDTVYVKGVITHVSTKIRRGNDIDIKADIELELLAVSVDTKYVITELKLGEERALPTSAFSVHIAKSGETLWDVAKSLGTTPELVLSHNPGIALPLNGGERVITYRHLKV